MRMNQSQFPCVARAVRLMAPLALLVGVSFHAAPMRAAAASRPPNIIVILADDMGFSDLGCYGGEIQTPNLDALARGGVRFTQFYNTARCCPTRASLLTGLHPHQAGVGHMMEDRGQEGYRGNLNRSCVTIAEALKPAGYRSYAVGKWHVTPGQSAQALEDRHNWPLQRGFDRYYGTVHGAGSYWDPSSLVRDNTLLTAVNDPQYQPKEFYYTDALSDHAVRFVREHATQRATQPFFLYLAYTAAHWPMHAKESDIAKYKGRYHEGYEAVHAARWAKLKQLGLVNPDWKPAPLVGDWNTVKDRPFEERCMEVYAAMVDCMDQGIGRLVAELKEQGQFDNTLILYLQDNGGCAEGNGRGPNAMPRADKPSLTPLGKDEPQFGSQPKQTRDGWPVRQGYGVMPGGPDTYVAYGREWANVSNTPFREYKHWTHEGGISTPLIAHWPAGLPTERRGRLEAQPGQLVDIMATCVDLAGATYPSELNGQKMKPLEGTSLRAALSGQTLQRTRPLVWEHEGNRAIRDGRWKLVAKENQPWELYDLTADRGEGQDLAPADPGRVKTMAAAWDAWAARAQVLPLRGLRGTEKSKNAPLSKENVFRLKAGDHLNRAQAPPITGRAFTITANFDIGPAEDGVIVAHGGTANGYALYLAGGQLRFTVRSRSGVATAISTENLAGQHTATAKLDARGTLTLTLDQRPARTATGSLLATMPTEGLDVGADEGGAVGPYPAPNRFAGKIESVLIQLDAP
jgi:arylsulfatase A-like enzyme